MAEFSDDEENPWTPTSDEAWVDPLVVRFGDEPLVRAARDADQVQQLLSSGAVITAEGLFAAIEALNLSAVKAFLQVTNPNIRSEKFTISSRSVYSSYSDRDVAPLFSKDWHDWSSLQFAAHASLGHEGLADTRALIMSVLLDHGAHMYAKISQPIRRSDICPFPGEEETSLETPDTEHGPHHVGQNHEPSTTPSHTRRTVLHAILEDGGCVSPILNQTRHPLSLSHRDDLGRTILHAACRSSIGADASPSATLEDCHWDSETGRMRRDPFASPSTSLFHAIRARGADLNAVDGQGKNIVHHLFDAQDGDYGSWRPPMIKDTLGYVLEHCRQLVRQPDRFGTYPLHAALQRRLRYPLRNKFTEMAELDGEIERLLEAGADPCVRDARGNSALHYLAAEGLLEVLRGKKTRELLEVFLSRGVDVNAKNKAGRSALEIMLDDDGMMSQRRASEYLSELKSARKADDVEKEVFDVLDEAGMNWDSVDKNGRGVLHLVAKYDTSRAAARAAMLIERGANVRVRDEEGKTSLDIARQVGNEGVAKLLESSMTMS